MMSLTGVNSRDSGGNPFTLDGTASGTTFNADGESITRLTGS